MSFDLEYLVTDNKKEPIADIAVCSECGWEGLVSDCETEEEGDWESGYYKVPICPKCEEGGCIDDYKMSLKRRKEWEEWEKTQPKLKENDLDYFPG